MNFSKAFYHLGNLVSLGAVLTGLSACNFSKPSEFDEDFQPGVNVNYKNSAVAVSESSAPIGQPILVTVAVRDDRFNPFISSRANVMFTADGGTSAGTFGQVTNHGNGTYSALFTGTSAGTAVVIHAMVNGLEIASSLPRIEVVAALSLAWVSAPTAVSKLSGGSSVNLSFTQNAGTNTVTSLKIYYAANGTSFSLLHTLANSATTYTWSVPAATDVLGAKLKLVAEDSAGNTKELLTPAFTIDSTAPSLSLTAPTSLRGGTTATISFALADATSGLNTVKIQYAANGTTFVDLSTLATSATSYSWVVPSDNTALAKLQLVAVDQAGNAAVLASNAFTIDSTPPSAPSVTVASLNPSSSTAATLTVSSCTDRTKIYVAEVSTVPAYDAVGWQTCSTSAGAITYTLSTGDGTKALSVFAQDAVGNVSAATTVTDVLDTSLPSLAWSTVPTIVSQLKGGSSYSLSWTLSDATSGVASFKLYYASNGTTYVLSNTLSNSATSLGWTVPSDTLSTAKIKLVAVDSAGNSNAIESSVFTIDSTGPVASITNLSGPFRGGATTTVTLSASDVLSGMGTLKFQYASNGTTFVDVATIANHSTSYTWTVASDSVATAKVRITATDVVGNVSTATTSAFTIDSTAPTAPSVSLASANPTASTAATLTVSSCSDLSKVYVSESATAPVFDASGWQNCSTAAGAIAYTLSAGEGTKTMYVFGQDAVGNVSASSSLTDVVDTTAPSAPPTTLVSGFINSATVPMTVGACTDTAKVLVNEGSQPAAGAAGWQNCVTTAGAVTYTLSSPSQGSTYNLKVWAKDSAENVSSSSTSLSVFYETVVPTISLFQLNGNSGLASGNTVSLAISAADTGGSGLAGYQFSLNSSFTGATWLASAPASYSLPFASGDYTVYVRVRDNAGNLSAVSNFAITLALASPPNLAFTTPTATTTYASTGDAVSIQWQASLNSSTALKPNGTNIQYLISGQIDPVDWPVVNSYPAGATLAPTANNSCTLAGSATGCVVLGLPAALVGKSFKIVLSVADQAGNVAIAQSAPMNGPSGLSLFAGLDASALGSSASVTDISNFYAFARHPVTGDIYLLRTGDILVIKASTGIVTRWAGNPLNTTLAGDGGALSAVRFGGGGVTSAIQIDSLGNVYWNTTAGIWKYDGTTASIILGPRATPASSADDTLGRNIDFAPYNFHLVNDKIYFAKKGSCGTNCDAFQIFVMQSNGKIKNVATGLLDSVYHAPVAGAAVTTMTIGSYTIVPVTNTTEKVMMISDPRGGYVTQYLYSVDTAGKAQLEVALPGGPYAPRLGKYISSKGSFAYWDSNYGTNVYLVSATNPSSNVSVNTYDGVYIQGESGPNGDYFFSTNYYRTLSYVSSAGVRSTFAGILPNAGDGGLATQAQIRSPGQLSIDPSGNAYIKDSGNNLIRKVNSSGTISSTIWGTTNTVAGGVNAVTFGTGIDSTTYVRGGYGTNYTSNSTNSAQTSGRGLANIAGACVYYCTENSTANFSAYQSSSATPAALSASNNDVSIYLSSVYPARDGTNLYLWLTERTGSTFRSYIQKIDNAGALTTIAGSTGATWSNPPPLVVAGPMSGTSAGSVINRGFWAASGILYMAQGSTSGIFSGVPQGNWVQQLSTTAIAAGTITSMVVDKKGSTDPLQTVVYFTRQNEAKIYYFKYTVTGGNTPIMVADFTGVLSTSMILTEVDPTNAKTLYLIDGNSIYKYNSTSLP